MLQETRDLCSDQRQLANLFHYDENSAIPDQRTKGEIVFLSSEDDGKTWKDLFYGAAVTLAKGRAAIGTTLEQKAALRIRSAPSGIRTGNSRSWIRTAFEIAKGYACQRTALASLTK